MTSEYERVEQERAAKNFVNDAENAGGGEGAYLRGHAIYAIASVAYETNRAYCRTIGQDMLAWERASQEIKTSAVMGVSAIVEERVHSPRESHEHWLRTRQAMGWTYGEEKDLVQRTHPCMVSWDELPEDEQRKDMLFFGIVVALLADPAQFGSPGR